jgi:hypothetical protein
MHCIPVSVTLLRGSKAAPIWRRKLKPQRYGGDNMKVLFTGRRPNSGFVGGGGFCVKVQKIRGKYVLCKFAYRSLNLSVMLWKNETLFK